MTRCGWAQGNTQAAYHDQEWGVPSRDDRHLFEMLILEGAQAGLSWSTILRKRPHYRRVYDGFDPGKVASFGRAKIDAMLADPGIVRHRLKVEASVGNARAFVAVQEAHGSFATYLWDFVDGRPVQHRFARLEDLPSRDPISERLSRDLKARGFRFVGPTTMYAYLQAVGLVNDHLIDCPRHAACAAMA